MAVHFVKNHFGRTILMDLCRPALGVRFFKTQCSCNKLYLNYALSFSVTFIALLGRMTIAEGSIFCCCAFLFLLHFFSLLMSRLIEWPLPKVYQMLGPGLNF